jgi:hypothetical protein
MALAMGAAAYGVRGAISPARYRFSGPE